MSWEDIVFQIALIVFPSGAVLLTTLFFLRKHSEVSNQRIVHELQSDLKKQRQEFFLPNRVEAYQRVILLLERIHPNSLVMRTIDKHASAAKYQALLLQSIRQEYDHNVAQQLFISPALWDLVKNAKEETVKIIHLASKQLSVSATNTDLATKLFELVADIGELPSEIAIKAIKEEFQRLF